MRNKKRLLLVVAGIYWCLTPISGYAQDKGIDEQSYSREGEVETSAPKGQEEVVHKNWKKEELLRLKRRILRSSRHLLLVKGSR